LLKVYKESGNYRPKEGETLIERGSIRMNRRKNSGLVYKQMESRERVPNECANNTQRYYGKEMEGELRKKSVRRRHV